MASTDALPIPRKNTAYRVVFPLLDADGDLVTGAAGLDSEISKDQGTFTDCTNEATEIATASGMYYLDLTATEMNADCVAIIVKTSTTGAKTTPIVLYPLEDGDWRVNVVQFGGAAGTFASGRPEVDLSTAATVEPTSVPASTATLKAKLDWLFVLARNTIIQSATTQAVKANDDATNIATSTVSDNGTTATRGKFS